jgi:hypothetical protein
MSSSIDNIGGSSAFNHGTDNHGFGYVPPVVTLIVPAVTLPTISYLCIPMPLPGVARIPLFEGANTTEFLDRFEDLCKEYGILEEDKLLKLPRYYS